MDDKKGDGANERTVVRPIDITADDGDEAKPGARRIEKNGRYRPERAETVVVE